MTLLAALVVVFAGFAGGATSIGGILVVPALTAAGAMPVHEAIAAANFAFIFTAFAPLVAARMLSSSQAPAGPVPGLMALNLAALVGAATGALTLQWLPIAAVRMVVAVLAVLSGALALRARKRAPPPDAVAGGLTHPISQVALGFMVGCGSAWSGTGGPVLLLPLLIFFKAPTRIAIAMAQVIQLPVALSSTAVNAASGMLDAKFGAVLGVLLLLGWGAGFMLARRVSVDLLSRILGFGLIAVGLWYGWQTFQN